MDVQDLTNYGIFTKPVLNPVYDYKFVITISNPNVAAGTAYADACRAVNFASSQAFDYYTIMNPVVNNDLLKRAIAKLILFYLTISHKRS